MAPSFYCFITPNRCAKLVANIAIIYDCFYDPRYDGDGGVGGDDVPSAVQHLEGCWLFFAPRAVDFRDDILAKN